MISHNNRAKRLEFCEKFEEDDGDVDDVCFTDESTIVLQSGCTHYYAKEGEEVPSLNKAKHPYKLHVWGGISKRGPTPIVIFKNNMDAKFFVKILEQAYVPWERLVWPEGNRFQQDNDPKHTSGYIVHFNTQ